MRFEQPWGHFGLSQVKRSGLLSLSDRDGRAMAAAAIDAFFDNDLLHATSLFMKKAKGQGCGG